MKKIFVAIMILVLIFTGCQKVDNNSTVDSEEVKVTEEKESIVYKVGLPGGVTSLSMVKLMKEQPLVEEGVDIVYENLNSPDLLASKLIGNELDIAVVPTNLAAKLYNKGIDYKIAGSSVWGVLYIASTEEIKDVNDLKGREIAVFGKGLSPDIILNHLLSETGISEDVKLNYVNGGQEVASGLIAEKFTTGLVPEPALSIVMKKNKNVSYILDVQGLWKEINGNYSYPQASLIVKGELIENNPEFVEKFVKEYSQAVAWVNENPDKATEYSNELELIKGIGKDGIERSNLNFVTAKEAKKDIEAYLNVLKDFAPDAVGGQLPDENFYY
ncbi:MAG: ABC transporter substrate-binding protein [Firmicutes bacterium]|jgi:NitT/TauT family transport system substrate-binding protein|nr:ABC transporter substrate-binding protein [Bacillota bacterium]